MNQIFTDFDLPLLVAAINMGFALFMGAIIGSERQIRGRMAGLRTNALVALGSAGFVTFAALFPEDINPTRVAAQVVSGIGFLGAGIIFRDGFNIQGINTAATLWCSAAVGMMAGTGHLPYAAVLTGLIVFINLALRPLVRLVNSMTTAKPRRDRLFQVKLRCLGVDEPEMRAHLVATLSGQNLYLHEIEVTTDADVSEITARVHGEGSAEHDIERAMGQIALETRVMRTEWGIAED